MSKIEWTDKTWNPIRARVRVGVGEKIGWHCVKVSEGCRNCYAETMNRAGRFPNSGTGLSFRSTNKPDVFLDEKVLRKPLSWRNPCKVFVCDMTDLFGPWVPYSWLDQIFCMMALCPQHTFQVLTKRPRECAQYLNLNGIGYRISQAIKALKLPTPYAALARDSSGGPLGVQGVKGWPLPNVHIGTSIENQETADERKPHLLECPAAVRFLSVEPLLEAVSGLFGHCSICGGDKENYPETRIDYGECRHGVLWNPQVDWVILGGESGPGARKMELEWALSIGCQCKAAGVPLFVKQLGKVLGKELGIKHPKGGGDMSLWPSLCDILTVREFPGEPAHA